MTAEQAALVDPTVVDLADRVKIEKYTGISLHETDPDAIRFVVDKSKQAGNTAFKEKRYKESITLYSQAIAGNGEDSSLFANRSAAYLAVGLYENALWDAQKAVTLRPDWAKAYYRLGSAHAALNQWPAAATAFRSGVELEPSNADLKQRLVEAEKRLSEADAARRAAAATARRSLVLKLRAARRDDQKLAMLNQFKQSMAAPDWELEDLEWRPSWLPRMRQRPLNAEEVRSDPKNATLLAFLSSLSDLAYPKTALRTLEDGARLHAFRQGLEAVLANRRDAHVLSLSSGGGVLALQAAVAGAGRVTAIERSRMLYRMAKQILLANDSLPGANNVHLLARNLHSVGVEGEEPPPQMTTLAGNKGVSRIASSETSASSASVQVAATSKAVNDDIELIPSRADILVTDLVSHSTLGMGLLPTIDHAARYLLAPGAVVLPSRVRVRAVLVELCLGDIGGFDLSSLDTYRWYPGDERVDLENLHHKVLSEPFVAHTLDLQARVDSVQKAAAAEKAAATASGNSAAGTAEDSSSAEKEVGEEGEEHWEADFEIDVSVTASGRWNAVAFWFELDLSTPTAGGGGGGSGNDSDDSISLGISSYAFPGNKIEENINSLPVGKSWGQAVQYLDGAALEAGSTVSLRIRQDAGQFVFTSSPPPTRLRHSLVPRWHYDMVLDRSRNDAYDDAIRRAVARKRDVGCRSLLALDMGAGSGLLAMMAARAGADEVFAAEVSGHMCDVAEETTISNGFLGKILVLDRDVRRMDTQPKPDGTAPELPRRADLAVFEVFDSGLIGEGILHILAAARAKLLAVDATLVPASAVVYAQPLEMRLDTVDGGIDVQQANRWKWRPDYEGVELEKCREDWIPLAEPLEVFSFDFYDMEKAARDTEATLNFAVNTEGVCNAVAMWFDLHLDEETTLSTSPYQHGKGPTWQQAVQWLPETRLAEGDIFALTARHDTYSISYSIEAGLNGGEDELKARSTGVPLVDPVWKAAHDGLQALNSQLVKACVQNPLEYRDVAQAAVQFACRPHDVGVDAAQAAEFCVKMMG